MNVYRSVVVYIVIVLVVDPIVIQYGVVNVASTAQYDVHSFQHLSTSRHDEFTEIPSCANDLIVIFVEFAGTLL